MALLTANAKAAKKRQKQPQMNTDAHRLEKRQRPLAKFAMYAINCND